MRNPVKRHAGVASAALICSLGVIALPGNAQVSKPTPKDLETAPVQFRAEVTGNPALAGYERRSAPAGMKPKTGAQDFTGAYSRAGRGGAAPGGAAAPGGGAPSGAAAPGSGPPAGSGQTANRGCVPDFVSGIGAGYPTHVVTGRDVMVVVQEENHKVRRVYLNAEHPKDLQPSIFGHSIGRFEGDTLVVETIGLKSGLTVVERFRKVENGRQVETISGGNGSLANWRPDLSFVEDICEDAGELFGPAYQTKDWKK
jgi:hypothetical protein